MQTKISVTESIISDLAIDIKSLCQSLKNEVDYLDAPQWAHKLEGYMDAIIAATYRVENIRALIAAREEEMAAIIVKNELDNFKIKWI